MEQTTPPTQISANEFRELLAKVNAPADFVEEELERWRARGLILPDPKPEPVEVALAAVLEKVEFQDERNRVPYSNGFRAGFKRAQELAQERSPKLTAEMVRSAYTDAITCFTAINRSNIDVFYEILCGALEEKMNVRD